MAKLDLGKRPICPTVGCNNERTFSRINKKSGLPAFQKVCSQCKQSNIAANHGLKSYGDVVAKNAGFDSSAEYVNFHHPYRKHRLSYCQNIDLRLGYRCTTTIMIAAQLEVDHMDGDPSNNTEDNLQTLCGCCHKYKTLINEDYKSPGRKSLGLSY